MKKERKEIRAEISFSSSDLYKPEIPKPKLDMKKERKNTSRNIFHVTNNQRSKKVVSSDLYKPEIPKPKRDMKKERKKYEQKYLSYKQPKTKKDKF